MFYFKNDQQLTVYFSNGDIAVWNNNSNDFDKILNLCIAAKWTEVNLIHNHVREIVDNGYIKNNQLFVNTLDGPIHVEVKSSFTDLIATLVSKGCIESELYTAKPFLMNCLENEYIDAVEELYQYCKALDFEITEDGCLLAYKNVNKDFSSIYDNGKTKHTIGEYTEVSQFNTDRKTTCSYGLHFCSKSYLSMYVGDKTIIVKVNPKDIVSIPIDYNFAKGRCKRYMMVGELAQDAALKTVNIKAVTGENVVKTKTAKRIEKKLSTVKASSRIEETMQWIEQYRDIYGSNGTKELYEKVASIMNISAETVKRNIRKYKTSKES